jgi:RNase adaptor protein for sRNA GlmZ degradation
LDLKVHVNNVDGTQMAAKINGTFELDNNTFEFLAIAFGRIGGQNIGVKLSEQVKKKLSEQGYDIEKTIDELQKKLISGNLSVPDGLKRDSFIDD